MFYLTLQLPTVSPGKHTGCQCHSLPPNSFMPATKSASSPQHPRINAEKHQAEQGRPEAAAPRKKCPHTAFSATWPASFQGCISAQSVAFQDGHLSQGQPSVCSPGVSNLTHSPRPSPSSSCSFSSDERLVAAQPRFSLLPFP